MVVGAGPAGSAVARLLASWGHRVSLIAKPAPRARHIAESLPPSIDKVLAAVGLLDRVERAGFYRSAGNTAWWETDAPRYERFGEDGKAIGYQVFRPDFDRLLLDEAASAGADVRPGAVRRVEWNDRLAAVDYQPDDRSSPHFSSSPHKTISARFVVDASGRAGVLARMAGRRSEPGYPSRALLGVWHCAGGWNLPDNSHTLVETCEQGWAWSVPVSERWRHVGVMVDRATIGSTNGTAVERAYRTALERTKQLRAICMPAVLEAVWACDASMYTADVFAGDRFLLVGDAASFIDPLSSFGVKKALASAWIGAVTVHTCLTHPARSAAALDLFSAWERRAYQSALRGTRAHARKALGRHQSAFWRRRVEGVGPDAGADDRDSVDSEDRLLQIPATRAALQFLRQAPTAALVPVEDIPLKPCALIRGHEVVVEEAIAVPEAPDGVRFLSGVDLLHLTKLTSEHHEVFDIYDAYCRTQGVVPLPSVLGGLSVLVANGVLTSSGRAHSGAARSKETTC